MSESQIKAIREKYLTKLKKASEAASKKSQEELVFEYKGNLYPSTMCSKETFQALESFRAREDDILIASYPKCGTNWTLQICLEVLFSGNKEILLGQAMMEFADLEGLKDLEGQPSPRVFTTHSHYDSIPRSFFENKVKTLLVLRNPKDNAVSFYHFSNANPVLPSYDSWDSFYSAYMDEKVCFGSYFDYLFAWNKHIDDSNFMAVTFEGLKEDFPSKIKQIAEFFGKPMTDEQIALAGSKTTFKSMKKGFSESHGDISSMIFRKGDIGDWKNYFTEEQSQEMNAKFEERLAGTKLGDMINYKKYCTY